jgi:hypothetical protein
MASDHRIHEFVTPQRRGLVALPTQVRERLHLDQPGAQVEFIEFDDGRIEVRGALPVPSDQAWFWTERWQAMEREVDEHVAAGRVESYDSVDDFLDALDD